MNFRNTNLRFMSIIMGITIVFASCTSKRPPVFSHEMPAAGPVPWLNERFDNAEGNFKFAIVTDLNGGEREGIFDIAIEQINLVRPELIVTVGDLVEGKSSNPDSIAVEYESFDTRARKANAPLFHVGGNHDLTDAVMRKVWKERYGAHYYYFVYKNVLFLVLDTEDHSDKRREEIDQARKAAIKVMDGPEPERAKEMDYYKMPERVTGNIGAEQTLFFKEVIAKHPEVSWTVLFMHKPIWKREGEGSLDGIERALSGKTYTVFNGHFHSYSNTTKNEKDHIILGTTGGHQNEKDLNSFDHFTLVTMTKEGPSIANLRLDGILNKYGKIPLNGDSVCFQASKCK